MTVSSRCQLPKDRWFVAPFWTDIFLSSDPQRSWMRAPRENIFCSDFQGCFNTWLSWWMDSLESSQNNNGLYCTDISYKLESKTVLVSLRPDGYNGPLYIKTGRLKDTMDRCFTRQLKLHRPATVHYKYLWSFRVGLGIVWAERVALFSKNFDGIDYVTVYSETLVY
jgi:hypothetical protein